MRLPDAAVPRKTLVIFAAGATLGPDTPVAWS
jgi:hypothetical protein